MIILYILLTMLGLLLLVLLLLVFMPLCLTISSSRQYVQLSIPPLAEGHMNWYTEEPRLGFRLLFWRKEWGVVKLLLDAGNRPAEKKDEEKEEKKPKQRSNKKRMNKRVGRFVIRKLKKNWQYLLRIAKVRTLYVNLDTDDYVVNAYLYPVFAFMSHRLRRPLGVNFHGRNDFELDLIIRPIWVLRAFLR